MKKSHFSPGKICTNEISAPGKPSGNFANTTERLGCAKMASRGLFVGLWVYFGSVFCSVWCFRSGIVLGGICIFFCVVIPSFTSLRGKIVMLFSLHFLLLWFWVHCFAFLEFIFMFFRCVTCFYY